MALNKWQQREVEQHARDNDVSEAEALAALFPEESGARRRPAAKVSTVKE